MAMRGARRAVLQLMRDHHQGIPDVRHGRPHNGNTAPRSAWPCSASGLVSTWD
jgi:hypothetical protein